MAANITDDMSQPPPPYTEPTLPTQSVAFETSDNISTGRRAWKPDDCFIAIVGVTGAGKSTFISQLSSDVDVEVGHGLQSKTRTTSVHESHILDGRQVWFIDTPGFDDTFTSNVDILHEVATVFNKLYVEGGRLSGLIYLHRITDPRMGGSAVANLEMFKKLCGPQAMPIVKLVSTRWDELDPGGPLWETAEQREKQLRNSEKFWANMIKNGAEVQRHFGTAESGTAILKSIVQSERRADLAIQTEMVKEGLTLAETTAGKQVVEQQQEIENRFQQEIAELTTERDDALAAKDNQLSQQLASELEQQKQQHAIAQSAAAAAREKLQSNFRRMDENIKNELQGSRAQEDQNIVEMQARISLLAHNVTALQEEMERKDQYHASQLRRLRRQGTDTIAYEDAESAREAEKLTASYKHEKQRYDEELRELRKRINRARDGRDRTPERDRSRDRSRDRYRDRDRDRKDKDPVNKLLGWLERLV